MKNHIRKTKEVLIYLSGFYSNRIFAFLLVPGIVGGVWLVFLGEFKIIFTGVIAAFSLRYVYKIITLPVARLTPLLIEDIRIKKKFWVVLIGFIISFYDFFVLALWVIFIFEYFFASALPKLTVPLIIWGYFITLGGIEYMATRAENDKRFGISINYVYTQFLFFLMVGLWLLEIDPLIFIFIVLLLFSGIVIREELVLAKKKKYPET